jgi:hypothetical protein
MEIQDCSQNLWQELLFGCSKLQVQPNTSKQVSQAVPFFDKPGDNFRLVW